MKHSKFDEVKLLVENDINVLLTGEAGTGKTTLLKQVAEELGLEFCAISMTRQTTLNSLLGFMSINGNYIPSMFRDAVENGKMLLLDEIDAADPNTILSLNTLENGFVAFPDKVVNVHSNFRLAATANPQDKHNAYTGRSKLDAATLSRFDIVELPLDPQLELSLTSQEIVDKMEVIRGILEANNITKDISMRDSIRYHKRKKLGLDKDYHKILLGSEDLIESYENHMKFIEESKPKTLEDCTTIDELWDNLPIKEKETSNESSTNNDPYFEELFKIAKDIAKSSLKSPNYVPRPGWEVSKNLSTNHSFMYVKVYNSERNKVFMFKEQELQ